MPTRKLPMLAQYPLVLVAGGAGFIGSHLCAELLKYYTVICIDTLSSGKRENIKELLSDPRFTFLSYELTRPIADLVRKRVKYIFHVAGLDIIQSGHRAEKLGLALNTIATRNLVEKALKDKATLVLISPTEQGNTHQKVNAHRSIAESWIREYARKYKLKATFIQLGYVFGPGMPLTDVYPLSILLKGLRSSDKLHLEMSSDTLVAPLFIEEAIGSIVKAVRKQKIQGKTFSVQAKKQFSLGTIAQWLRQLNSQFHVQFLQESSPQSQKEEKHTLFEQQVFLQQLSLTIAFLQGKKQHSVNSFPKDSHRRFSVGFLTLLFLISFLSVSLILPLVAVLGFSTLGGVTLQGAYARVKKGELSAALESARLSAEYFSLANRGVSVLTPYFVVLKKDQDQQQLTQLLSLGVDAAETTRHMSSGMLSLGEVFKQSLKQEGSDTKPLLNSAISEITVGVSKASLLQKQLEEESKKPLPEFIKQQLVQKLKLLEQQKQTITLVSSFTSILPEVLGFEGKRTYLMLLQNNMELRPGGGFIGSYGIISFESGKLSSFEIFDVYTADGQMKGHVDPPEAIRKHLNQPNWFLRDSNWDVDFEANAQQAMWFLQKEIGTETQGVIAVDVSFVQTLLASVGPLSIPEYKEVVSSSNLFEKAQLYAEKDFFPGSTQKRDFLGAVSRRLIDTILHDEEANWVSLSQALKKGLEEKHLLLSFTNPAIQQVFSINNWSGKVLSLPASHGMLSDYRMIVEANLGLNKVNYFLKRSIKDELAIGEEGNVRGKLTIVYANNGSMEYPAGEYKTYPRVLFPLATKLLAVSVNGEQVPSESAKTTSMPLGVEETTTHDKTAIALLASVAPKTKKTIEFAYLLADPYPLVGGSTTYSYMFQKQPGVGDDPLQVSISYPEGIRFKNANASVLRSDQLVTLSTN